EHFTDGTLIVTDQNITHAVVLLRRQRRRGARWERKPANAQLYPVPLGCFPRRRCGATATQNRFPGRVWNEPTPCLHGLVQSDKRSPDPTPCLLRTPTEMAQRFSLPAVAACLARYRRR